MRHLPARKCDTRMRIPYVRPTAYNNAVSAPTQAAPPTIGTASPPRMLIDAAHRAAPNETAISITITQEKTSFCMVDPFNIDAASSRVWCHTCHPNVGRCTIASFLVSRSGKLGTLYKAGS